MSIKETVFTALSAVLSNTWAKELPPEPTWPAIIFEVSSVPEAAWVQGGGYTQHTITVSYLAKTQTEIATIDLQVKAAMELIPGYLTDGESGDADYEDDASVYGYFSEHVIRLRTDLG